MFNKKNNDEKKLVRTSTLLIVSLIAIFAIGMMGFQVASTVAVSPPEVTKVVAPININQAGSGINEVTTVTIEVTGNGSTSTTTVPMDVVFALDSSGSMTTNDPLNLRRTAAKSFVDMMDSTKDTAGVVSWDDNIDFTQPLSSNFPLVKSQIDLVDSSGGTNLNIGLNSAIGLLDTGKQPGASWAIIFLTDGQGTYTYASSGGPASVAASKGYVIYSIGLGSSPATGPLMDMATATGGQYYSSPSASNLAAIFNSIYTTITTSTIPHYVDVIEVTQSYIIDEGSFNIAPNSVITSGGITTITWNNIGLINDADPDLSDDETVTLTFEAKSDTCGTNLDVQVYGSAKVEYDDLNNIYVGSVLIPQAKINVNCPPVADADGPYIVNENTSITFDASGSYDPDGDPLQYKWDFDNDGIWDTAWSISPYATNKWCDDFIGNAKVEVTDGILNDDDIASVTVLNVAPTVFGPSDATIYVGQTYTGGGSFMDPGCDTWTATIDYGDGTGVQPLPLTGMTFSLSHQYLLIGDFTVTIVVTDDDGGVGSDSFIVHVLCIPQVWVDDNALSSWYDYAHVNKIQTAVDRVCPGGIVFVYDGTYLEDVIVPQQKTDITICGEGVPTNPNTRAVVQGSINIFASGVTIKCMWFKCSTEGAVFVDASGAAIRGNVFESCCDPDSIGIKANYAVDAEYNWWGAPNGPNGGKMDDGTDADGFGVQVIGQVDVDPWIGIHAKIIEPTGPINEEVGTPIQFDASGSWAYTFNDNCWMGIPLALQYEWDFDDGTYSHNKDANHVFDSPGTYEVTLMVDSPGIPGLYANLMYDWDYVTVTITEPGTPLSANADGNKLGGYETVVDESIQLFGTAIGGNPPYSFKWDLGDDRSVSEQNPTVVYPDEGEYTLTLTVTDSKGKTAYDGASIIVYGVEELIVKVGGPYSGIVGNQIKFTSDVIGGTGPFIYLWEFGDGTTSNQVNPIHNFDLEGTYLVTLTVTDSIDITNTCSTEVVIEKDGNLATILGIRGGLGISATIQTGNIPVDWSIKIDGFVLFGSKVSGNIPATQTENVNLPLPLGLGDIRITVTANTITKEYEATIFGPFVFSVKEVE